MSVTRFAPSPTGRLHLGHAASALFSRQAGERFLLRIEDIDPIRCRAEHIEGIFEDLRWLGVEWEGEVRRQSEHMADYSAHLDRLRAAGLLYPCFCTRKEILEEARASASAPHEGEDGPVYSGTCRRLSEKERAEKAAGRACVWRIDMEKAVGAAGALRWRDRECGDVRADPARFGDIVLARKDVPASYHLCVVADDALQGVTLVTRGKDLFAATDIHVLLQKLLGLPTPEYWHHPLLFDARGRKFSKRDKAATLCSMREDGLLPEKVREMARF